MRFEWSGAAFGGAKIGLIHDNHVLTYRRDDIAGIPFPDCWDLPGGGREGHEAPVDCLLREVHEEFGLQLRLDQIIGQHAYTPPQQEKLPVYFFWGHLYPDQIAEIRFGDEGQYWQMMPVAAFLDRPDAIPYLQRRLANCLTSFQP